MRNAETRFLGAGARVGRERGLITTPLGPRQRVDEEAHASEARASVRGARAVDAKLLT